VDHEFTEAIAEEQITLGSSIGEMIMFRQISQSVYEKLSHDSERRE
jgi:hypothetical protein